MNKTIVFLFTPRHLLFPAWMNVFFSGDFGQSQVLQDLFLIIDPFVIKIEIFDMILQLHRIPPFLITSSSKEKISTMFAENIFFSKEEGTTTLEEARRMPLLATMRL